MAHVDEGRFEIEAVELCSRNFILMSQKAKILPETATSIQEVATRTKTREGGSIKDMKKYGVTQKPNLPYTSV